MASLRRRGKVWFCRYRTPDGQQKEQKCGPDKSVANQIKRDLEGKLCRIKSGTLDPRESLANEAERIPLAKHVRDYLRYLAAKGCVPDHVNAVRIKLEWLLRETGIIQLSQLKPSVVVEALAMLKANGRSDRTCFHYATSVKALSHWLKKEHRTRFDLLGDLERPTVVTEGERPALSPEQTAKLVEATRTGPDRRGMTGVDRSWLYLLAATTGFRRLELQALKPESFDLRTECLTVTLPAPATKNRKGAVQPLPVYIIPDLQDWLGSKPDGGALFPPVMSTASMIREDLKAAGIRPEKGICFHSLRHSYVSGVVQSGASVKVCMELARHSRPDLTFRRYSHSQAEDRANAVNRLSHILPTPTGSSRLNGATSTLNEMCPDESQPDLVGHGHEEDRLLPGK